MQLSKGLEDDQNVGNIDSDRDLDNVEAILDDALRGIERIDPRRAQIIAETSRSPLVNPPQAGSSATASLGASSAYGQTIDPQGRLLVVRTECRDFLAYT